MRKEIKKLKLAITYDMGWKKISFDRRIDSSILNELILFRISKGAIIMSVCSKALQR